MHLDWTAIIKNITKNYFTFGNVSLLIFTILESYVFPLAVIKWMIILNKYGGLVKLLKKSDDCSKIQAHSRYLYSLKLLTAYNKDADKTNWTDQQESHVSLVVENVATNQIIQLSYCGQECQSIPPALWKVYGPKVQHLDLSYNSIEALRGLEHFSRLEELILDNNKLSDNIAFPHLPYLRTLSINNNQITNLEAFINAVVEKFPLLSYLSLLSNKACPNELSDADKDDSDYQRYRYFVIYKLPALKFLDSRRISSWERREAASRGEFTLVRRPLPPPPPPPPSVASPVTLRPLPVDFNALGKHKGAYGKCQYKYTGKHSEGNRFIVNNDL